MYCAANRTDLPWSDVRPCVDWVDHVVPLRNSHLQCHMIFTSGLGLHTYSVCPDILHVLDLGPTQYLHVGAIFMLVWANELPGNLDTEFTA